MSNYVQAIKQGLRADVSGRIYGTRGMERATHKNNCGYYIVTYKERGTQRRIALLAHRFIWVYFHGEVEAGLQVNHKDGDKSNNSLDNLELLTPSENISHYKALSGEGRGEKCNLAVLKETDVIQIKQRLGRGEKAASIAADYPVSQFAIFKIAQGRAWRHVHA